jgi:adenine-specific DNA-methyltransferase
VRAFRDTWKLGIHSYLAVLRDWLVNARELLTETGSIFVQIGDKNVHLVRCVLDEVFGCENHVATISFQKTGSTDQALVPQTVDHLLFYAKSVQVVKYRQLYQERTPGTLALERYDLLLKPDGSLRRLTGEEIASGKLQADGVRAQLTALTSARPLGKGDLAAFEIDGVSYTPGTGTLKTDLKGMRRLVPAKLTASGRVTQKASSDPACFSHYGQGHGGRSDDSGAERDSSSRQKPLSIAEKEPGLLEIHAPNGGYLT